MRQCHEVMWYVRHRRVFSLVLSVYRLHWPGNEFELNPMVKVETRYPVEGSNGSEFSSIYNRAQSRQHEVARLGKNLTNLCVFFGKRPLTKN